MVKKRQGDGEGRDEILKRWEVGSYGRNLPLGKERYGGLGGGEEV